MTKHVWTILGCLWLAGCGAAPGGGGGGAQPTPSPSLYPPPGGGGRLPQPTPSPTMRPTTSQAVVVAVRDFQFVPSTVVVSPGTVVTWRFEDAVAHTSTSAAGSAVAWDSGRLSSGQTFSREFNAVGSYPYYCALHPRMTGTIEVR